MDKVENDKKIAEVEGAKDPNSTGGTGTQTTQPAQPVNAEAPAANSGIDAQVKALTEKIDTLARQYDGSTKEALRLKEENDALKKKIEEVAKTGSTTGVDEKSLQRLIDEKGLAAALDHFFGSQVASLKKSVESLVTDKSKQVYENFKASHKGLLDTEVVKKFDSELSKLTNVYDDIHEAMEKAYLLAGGKEVELKAAFSSANAPKTEDVNKANQKVVDSVIGGSDDKRPAPAASSATDLQKQINDLTVQAVALQNRGSSNRAAEIFAKIEELRSQLGAKV